MIITSHFDSKGTAEAVHVQSEALGLRMVFYPKDPYFKRICVYEKGLLNQFWKKFSFGTNIFGKTSYSASDGFGASEFRKYRSDCVKETYCQLYRHFYNAKTKMNESYRIMNVRFYEGNATEAELSELVDNVLVPVAIVYPNGGVSYIKGHGKDVTYTQTPSSTARFMPNGIVEGR